MVNPLYEASLVATTEAERLQTDVYTGRVRIGPEAAREIARTIEDGHGFWDFEQRRDAA